MTRCSSLLEAPAQETQEDHTCRSRRRRKAQQEWQGGTSSKPRHAHGAAMDAPELRQASPTHPGHT